MNKGHASLSRWGLSQIEWKSDWTILDIGCGGGANLKRMADFCPQGKIYGIDISSESVKFARKEIKKLLNTRCFISQGNVMNLPYEKGTFDLITAFETVYFWGNLQKTFNEVHRVLKNGGLFLICCEASDPSDETWTSRIDGMVVHSAQDLESCLARCGFSNITTHRRNKENLCVIAQKIQ